jgi:16S rRNA (uracil1498-N3)-methyltransferase
LRRRFFVPQFDGDSAELHGAAAEHLARVLRAEAGQVYELSDGSQVRLARIERVARDRVEFALMEQVPAREASLPISLLLAIVKFDRFEWAIEKATELGVGEMAPLAASRSEKALVAAAPKRAARWEKILFEAAQQSRALRPPVLHPLAGVRETFQRVVAGTDELAPLLILCSEEADTPSLRHLLPKVPPAPMPRVVLAIGPEGGWTPEEFAGARASGFVAACLGPRILRTETAVIAAIAAIQYALANG